MTEIPEHLRAGLAEARARAASSGTDGARPVSGDTSGASPHVFAEWEPRVEGEDEILVDEPIAGPDAESRGGERKGFARNAFSAVRNTRVGKVATNAAMAFAIGWAGNWAGNNVIPSLSDASNVKAGVATAGLAFSSAMLGRTNWSEFGKAVKPTVAGIGGAAVSGFFLGNIFTGGWHEQGSVGLAAAGAAIAGVSATGVKMADVKNKHDSGSTRARHARSRRFRPIAALKAIPKVAGETLLKEKSERTKLAVKSLGFGATTLAVTETSNALNWPFGGFNHTGVFLSAAAVSTGVVFGGKIKEKVSKLNENYPVATKVGGAALGLVALGAGFFAWKHGIIGGHSGGKGGAHEHTDKIPTGSGKTGSSTSTSLTTSTTGSSTSTSTFTLSSFSAANKSKMVEQITGMGIPAPKANTIADQILAGQYKGVAEHPEAFAKFVGGKNQAFADWAFQKDVAALAG